MKTRGGKALRSGWTTGTCSAAAAKAATRALVSGTASDRVEVALPGKDGQWAQRVTFPVERCQELKPGTWQAVVVKDAGDDPDVTHGAHLTATVSWREGGRAGAGVGAGQSASAGAIRLAGGGIELEGGEGVGVVTKPGLGLEIGGPAINPVPRAMIERAVSEALGDQGAAQDAAGGRGAAADERVLRVVISVPGGEVMARKTTNRRLGILGGISILGTTGIVRPFSTASWRASVEQAVAVLGAQAESTHAPLPPLVLCTGGRTEKGAMALLPGLPEVCFVEVGDFTGAALRKAVEHAVPRVVFVGMIGKLTKLAAGVLMTHYTRSAVDPDVLADITRHATGDEALAERVSAANTARHAYEVWQDADALDACGRALCDQVADVLERFTEGRVSARAALVDFTGRTLVAASANWDDA
ncbi:MAG TPA: cobalt-precorrin-5B (C(1))-methyltransferase CbiD [Actinocrinis sp.]|nr:cobalt-precorrin-5B (C(1))-methyltransferase CbiD [Actinocrinis sp.]